MRTTPPASPTPDPTPNGPRPKRRGRAHAAAKHPRRLLMAAGVAVVAIAAAGVGVTLAGEPGLLPSAAGVHTTGPSAAAPSVPGAATPSTSASPVPSTRVASGITPVAAAHVVSAYATKIDALTPKTALASLKDVAAGRALDEIQAQIIELHANGWTVRGTTRIQNVKVLHARLTGAHPIAEVQACVDSSHVSVVRSDGRTTAQNPAASRRALNLYSLQADHGVWRIVAHSFPNDPTC
jgi:hypothetical protein